jgi:hypothetical protein
VPCPALQEHTTLTMECPPRLTALFVRPEVTTTWRDKVVACHAEPMLTPLRDPSLVSALEIKEFSQRSTDLVDAKLGMTT